MGFEKLLGVLIPLVMSARGQELGQWFIVEFALVRSPVILMCDKFQDHRISKHSSDKS